MHAWEMFCEPWHFWHNGWHFKILSHLPWLYDLQIPYKTNYYLDQPQQTAPIPNGRWWPTELRSQIYRTKVSSVFNQIHQHMSALDQSTWNYGYQPRQVLDLAKALDGSTCRSLLDHKSENKYFVIQKRCKI